MSIYTRRGDRGMTDLANGERTEKTTPQVEAYGTIDELNAHIGLLHTYLDDTADRALMERIQRCLFGIGTKMAGGESEEHLPTGGDLADLERWIDDTARRTGAMFAGFVLPGGCRGAAIAHVARTVARRAERCALRWDKSREQSESETEETLIACYLNRLSDFLYAMAKKLNYLSSTSEIKL